MACSVQRRVVPWVECIGCSVASGAVRMAHCAPRSVNGLRRAPCTGHGARTLSSPNPLQWKRWAWKSVKCGVKKGTWGQRLHIPSGIGCL